MSTELKRVPLDFDWPLDKVWHGFINHFRDSQEECKLCQGSGYSPYAKSLHDKWYGYVEFHPKETGSTPFLPTDKAIVEEITRKVKRDDETYEFYRQEHLRFEMGLRHPLFDSDRSTPEEFEAKWGVEIDRDAVDEIVPVVMTEAIRMCNLYNGQMSHHLDDEDVKALIANGRLKDLTHDFVPGQGWTEKSPKVMPSAREVNLWSLSGFGHDGLNQHFVIEDRCKRAGKPKHCMVCEGDGYTQMEKGRKLAEAWRPTEPPEGEGYQMWETVSEGAPISPVFETPEALAEWLADNATHKGLSKEEWLSVIGAGGASVSFAIVGGEMMNGEQFVARGKA